MKEITKKHRRFIDEYLKDLNATQAAIRSGYSKKTARQIGYKLLTLVYIKKEIDLELTIRHEQQIKKFMLSAEIAMNALVEVAQSGKDSARVSAANSILDRAGHRISGSDPIKTLCEASVKNEEEEARDMVDELITCLNDYRLAQESENKTL